MFGGFTYKNMFSKSRIKTKSSSKRKVKSKTSKIKKSASGRRVKSRY
jgi:hypothetical protein